jgi:hypothetical protein
MLPGINREVLFKFSGCEPATNWVELPRAVNERFGGDLRGDWMTRVKKYSPNSPRISPNSMIRLSSLIRQNFKIESTELTKTAIKLTTAYIIITTIAIKLTTICIKHGIYQISHQILLKFHHKFQIKQLSLNQSPTTSPPHDIAIKPSPKVKMEVSLSGNKSAGETQRENEHNIETET